MLFRIQIPISVECQSDELDNSLPVSAEVVYRGGKWQGHCQQPPLVTELSDTLEQALVAIAKEIARDARLPQPHLPVGN